MRDILQELSDIETLNKEIEWEKERLAQLRSSVEGLTHSYRIGSPGTAEQDKMAAMMAQIMEVEGRLLARIVGKWNQVLDIEEALDCLTGEQRDVIKARYIDRKTLTQIAEDMPCSYAMAKRIHTQAKKALIEQGYSAAT